jgi:hypothetical protein
MGTGRQEKFLNLPFQEKLEFLYGLPARQKRDLILSAPEAERLVQSFTPETLFYTLKEIGHADAGDLLSLAIPEQVKGLFDLDCWDRDRPNLDRMRDWLEAMAEEGRKPITDALMECDLELVALLLRQYLRVHRVDEPEASDLPFDTFVQFDEHYLIEFIRHDATLALIQDFLEEAFERDYKYYASLMEEIYWGIEAELEEQAYTYRIARLADRGFPDFFEAQDVFAYVDPQQFREIRATYVAPTRDELPAGNELPPETAPALLEADNSLFNAALTAGFAAQGRRELRSEMAMVANQVLVARQVDFGDIDAVRVAVEMTHNLLNLGLEHLAGGELSVAIENLRDTPLKLLFRLGVSLTIDLRGRAEATVTAFGLGARPREIPYLDSPYREALAGFLGRMPQFYGGLDGDGSVAMRDFRAIRDLHLGYAMLEQLDALPEFFRALLGLDIRSLAFRSQIAGHDVMLSQILLTVLARQALDATLVLEPIEPDRLNAMHAATMTQNGRPAQLSDSFRKLVADAIDARVDGALRARSSGFVDSCLNILEDELADLEPERVIDPRFIRSVLIRRIPAV